MFRPQNPAALAPNGLASDGSLSDAECDKRLAQIFGGDGTVVGSTRDPTTLAKFANNLAYYANTGIPIPPNFGERGLEHGLTWVHADLVTKSQRFTSSAGVLQSQRIDLDPWGVETNRSVNSQMQPRRFTTYERDQNGSDEAMHRRYNSVRTRFDQPDPWDGSYELSDPQSFNRYSYAQNDPVNFVDPSGLVESWNCSAQYSACGSSGYSGTPFSDSYFLNPWGDANVSENIARGWLRYEAWLAEKRRELISPQNPEVPVIPEQKYNDCAKKLGNSPAPGYGQALSILWASALDKVDPTLLAVTWAAEAIPPFNFSPVSNYRPDDGGWDVGPLQASTTYYNKSPYTDGLDKPFGTVFSETEPFNGNSFSSLRVGARAYALDILPRSKNRADAAGLYRAGSRKNPAKSGYNDRVKQFNNWSKGYDDFFNCLKK